MKIRDASSGEADRALKNSSIRRLSAVSCLAALALPLFGCTTMETTHLESDATPVEGQIYYLPRIDYQIGVERELRACTFGYESEADAAFGWLTYAFGIIDSQTNPIATTNFNLVIADPVMQLPEIEATLNDDARLGENWQTVVVNQSTKTYKIGAISERLASKEQPAPKLLVKVEMRATAAPLVSHDPDQVYVIKYQEMEHVFKRTDYSVDTYPNGTLKSINVTLEDQTGDVILGVLNGTAKLAAASSGFPISFAESQSAAVSDEAPMGFAKWRRDVSERNSPCNAVTRLKLVQRNSLAGQVEKNAEAALELEKANAKSLDALAKATATRDEKRAEVDELEEGDAKKPAATAELKVAAAELKTAQKAADEAKSAYELALEGAGKVASKFAAIRKELTQTRVTTVRPEAGVTVPFELDGVEEAGLSWLKSETVAELCKDANKCVAGMPSEFQSKLRAVASIYPSFSKAGKSEFTGTSGVTYRQPVKTTLFVCKEVSCLDEKKGSPTNTQAHTLLAAAVDIPQLGVRASLPLKNGPFQNNTISASFAENGALIKLAYKSNAAAAKAAEVFEASADTVLTYTEAKRKQQTNNLASNEAEVKAETQLLTAQLELEKAQAELDKFRKEQATPTP